MCIYVNCLSYSNKTNYLNYLKKLDHDSLIKEYCLNCNLDDDLKYHYNLFKSHIYLNIIEKAKRAFKLPNTDYKVALYELINELKLYFIEEIEPYYHNIKNYNNASTYGYDLEGITPSSLISIYDCVYDGSEEFGSGSFNALQSLVNLIHNNLKIKLYHLYGIGNNIPSQYQLYPKYLIGKQYDDGSWDYKSCLEMFICNLISWFDIIESYYYN